MILFWKQAYFICSVQAEEFAWWIAWNLGSEMKTSWSTVRIWASDARIHDTCKKRYTDDDKNHYNYIFIIKNGTQSIYICKKWATMVELKKISKILQRWKMILMEDNLDGKWTK